MKARNQKLETRNEKLEMTNENKQFEKNRIIKKEPKEIKSPNWFDKNKFKEILAIIDSNKFNYKNKIGEFKYIDIKDLVNNIKNNTISEIDAKKDLNALNEIKNVEIIKYKKRTPGHKKLLNLFDDLSDIILTDKTLESQENEKVKSKKEENKDYENEDEDYEYENEDEDYENEDEHRENEDEDCENEDEDKNKDEKVESKKEEDEDYENEDEDYENEYEDDDETMSQNEIKEENDYLDKIIDKSKSFKD